MHNDDDALFAEALARCATEKIHLVGSIQAHGVVLGVDDEYVVCMASCNCEQFFKCYLRNIIGQSVADLLGSVQADRVRNLRSDNARYSDVCHVRRGLAFDLRMMDIHAYRSDGLLILELQDASTNAADDMESMFGIMRDTLRSLYEYNSINDLSNYITQQIRALTDYDRVMVYRFDHLWNGAIIAESRNNRLTSFLGNHFPASDIPEQARALYAINQIRVLVDTEEQAVTLQPSLNPLTAKPLDMSLSDLRSMSPVHLAYMRNMGVRATLTISLMVKGRLWGMICCHHQAPKNVSFRMRELVEVIGRMMSSQLGVLEAEEYSLVMRGVRETLVQLTHMINESADIGKLIQLMETQVLQLVNATGAVIVIGKDRYDFGRTPPPDEVHALTEWVKGQPLPDAAFFTDALQEQYPQASHYADVGAGLLAVALNASFEDYILWFRGEILDEIVWAGDRHNDLVIDEKGVRLDPQHSFAAWVQVVRGRAQPWLNVEVDAGRTLSRSFMVVLAQKARRTIEMEYLSLIERNTAILESAGDGVIGLDKEGHITFANRTATRLLATTKEDLIGRNVHDAVHVYATGSQGSAHPKKECPIMRCILEQRVIQHDQDGFGNEKIKFFPVEYIVTPLFSNSSIDGAVLVFRDVTATRMALRQIAHQATHDDLTGLPNRILTFDRLEHALLSAAREHTYVGVMFLDLDRFKIINDSLGHEAGDFVLHQVAKRLQQIMRAVDTVGRQGGDEFIVVIPDMRNQIHCAKLAKKILKAVSAPYFYHGHELNMTFSIGISLYPRDGVDSAKLIKNADAAMYYAKKTGRNNYQFYSQQMNSQAAHRLALEVDLRYAVARRELVVHYQPKVDALHKNLIGAEALLRWNHPKLGLLSPSNFISIAEESGLIVHIGQWVIQETLRQNKEWFDQGLAYVPISVNLSAVQFNNKYLVESLRMLLSEVAMPPALLELELTESVLMQNTASALATLRKLKGLGLSLSIDDFGTGYSSLSHLKNFPFDTIKIDQSFVKDIGMSNTDTELIKAIISMAHSLKMTAIAEGVESKEQCVFLEEQRCDEMQGFYFSCPVSASRFELMLRDKSNIHPESNSEQDFHSLR